MLQQHVCVSFEPVSETHVCTQHTLSHKLRVPPIAVASATSSMSAAGQHVTTATTDCGDKGSTCATNLTGLASAMTAATAKISSMADDCKDGSFVKCMDDVTSAAMSVASVSLSITKAAKECGSSALVELVLSGSSDASKGALRTERLRAIEARL